MVEIEGFHGITGLLARDDVGNVELPEDLVEKVGHLEFIQPSIVVFVEVVKD